MKTWRQYLNKKNLLFIALFTLLGLIALQVPFTQLAGSKVKFTLFDFFGPIATGFIGTLPGVISVLLMQLTNFALHGAQVVDTGTIIRFFPMLFAAWYFGSKNRVVTMAVPLLAIAAFIAHPVGRTVWYFSLFWLIPIICYSLRDRFLLARSLGATFTAHAVGGALWIYAFNLPANVWISLIPVVAIERSLFALGIAAAYLIFNHSLHWLTSKKIIDAEALVNKRYVWGFLK